MPQRLDTGWAHFVQLSPECKDLLNQIFVIDTTKRISLQGIKDHPWYSLPLPTKYADGEVKIEKAQEKIAEYISTRRISQVNSCHPESLCLLRVAAWQHT